MIHHCKERTTNALDSNRFLAIQEKAKIEKWTIDSPVTYRQKQILQLLSEGYTAKEIAATLFISHHTVISHGTVLKVKFNAKNCTHLVAIAIRMGSIQ